MPKLDTQSRQRQIVQAVLDIVADRGVADVTIAGVARRVGLVPSAVYRHFRSKDQLLDAVLEFLRSQLLGNIEIASTQGADARDRLHRLLMLHVRLIRENAALPRLVLSEHAFSGRRDRRHRLHAIVRDYLRAIADILRGGQARGEIDAATDADTLAVMFLGLVQPAAILWQLSDGGFDVTRHARRAWQVFEQAISPPDATLPDKLPRSESP